tara:strand:- start:24765 stop:25340 length:576 start_codon:yes stop_codon:yes gene_type:complete
MRLFFSFAFIFIYIQSFSQEKPLNVLDFQLVNGDTVFVSNLAEIDVLSFKNKQDRSRYYILKRRVLKVYPYALMAKEKLEEIRIKIDSIPKKRHKKRYTREVARWVKDEYTDRLKNLTMSEGKILVKLIYRETRTSSYEILKSYRGRFNAFFWQTMAKLWDNNLKTQYDPLNIKEDMLIEHIIIHEATLEE